MSQIPGQTVHLVINHLSNIIDFCVNQAHQAFDRLLMALLSSGKLAPHTLLLLLHGHKLILVRLAESDQYLYGITDRSRNIDPRIGLETIQDLIFIIHQVFKSLRCGLRVYIDKVS